MKMLQTFIIVVMKIVQELHLKKHLDGMFKCPSCQNVLNIKKNEKSRKAYSKKIDEIKKDMQQTF